MDLKKDFKIVTILFKYDYGIKDRGEGLEYTVFFPAIKKISENVIPFWIEDHGYPQEKEHLQEQILDFVELHNPKIVFFVLMRDEITLQTIRKISKKCITINWFCDDQWRFESFTKKLAPALSYNITVDKYSLSKYKDIGCNNVLLSQWATLNNITNIDFDNINYEYDISFIGGKNPTREWYISELEKVGYKVTCFGFGWKNGKVTSEEMKQIFLKSRINLNLSNSYIFDSRFGSFLNKKIFLKLLSFKIFFSKKELKILKHYIALKKTNKNVEQIKMRNFEIPAYGGFELTHYALSIEDYFVPGKEIAVFGNIEDLKKQINYYLLNDEEALKIKKAGYKRALTHTYENRFQDIFQKIIEN